MKNNNKKTLNETNADYSTIRYLPIIYIYIFHFKIKLVDLRPYIA